MIKAIISAVVLLTIMILTNAVRSQVAAGSVFTLEKAVVSNGGGVSSGTTFSLEGTSGQTAAGETVGSFFRLQGGFWSSNLAPTAASVSISGRVRTLDGGGLRNAIVMLTDQSGTIRTTRTTTFGAYRFDEIAAGQTVILNVNSKLYRFAPLVVSVSEDLAELDFTAIGENLLK